MRLADLATYDTQSAAWRFNTSTRFPSALDSSLESVDEVVLFVEALFSPFASLTGARIEIRTFKPQYTLAEKERPEGPRDWFEITPEGFRKAAKAARYWANRTDVYFGVLPRRHGGGKAADVKLAGCIWVDIDAGDEGFDEASDLLVNTIMAKGLPRPHVIVRSGGGLHAYWRLAELVKCATTEQQNRVRDVMKRLVLLIGGDLKHAHACPKANDVARVLRLPGTFNRKIDGEPRPVELLRIYPDDPPKSLVWWEAFLPAIPLPPPYIPPSYGNRGGNYSRSNGQQRGLLPATVQRITQGAPEGRKHYDMVTVATAARKQGFDEDAIRAAAEAFGVNAGVNMGDPAQQRHLEGVVRWAMREVVPDPI